PSGDSATADIEAFAKTLMLTAASTERASDDDCDDARSAGCPRMTAAVIETVATVVRITSVCREVVEREPGGRRQDERARKDMAISNQNWNFSDSCIDRGPPI